MKHNIFPLILLLISLCNNALIGQDCMLSNQPDSFLINNSFDIAGLEVVPFVGVFGQGMEIGETFSACKTANIKKVFFPVFGADNGINTPGDLLLSINQGANTNNTLYTQSVLTSELQIVQDKILNYYCISLDIPFPVDNGVQYAVSLGDGGSTASFNGAFLLYNMSNFDLTPENSGFYSGGMTALNTTLNYFDIAFRIDIGCPNAGMNKDSTIFAKADDVINLFDILKGEDANGTWEQIIGEGGSFDAENGLFKVDQKSRESTFRYTVTASGNCDQDDFAEINLITFVDIPTLSTWGMIILGLLFMIIGVRSTSYIKFPANQKARYY